MSVELLPAPPYDEGASILVASEYDWPHRKFHAAVGHEAGNLTFAFEDPRPIANRVDPRGFIRAVSEKYPLASQLFGIELETRGVYGPSDYAPVRSLRIPSAEGLNAFKARYLVPLGAHALSFAYAEGQGGYGAFTVEQIAEGLASKRLLIGVTPFYLLHDTRNHALAAASIHERAMDVHVALAQRSIDLRPKNPELARKIAVNLAIALDSETEYFNVFEQGHHNIPPDRASRQAGPIRGSRLTSAIFSPHRGSRGPEIEFTKDEEEIVDSIVLDIDPELAITKDDPRNLTLCWEVGEELAAYYRTVVEQLATSAPRE